jgi:protein phosphatase PTC4
MGNLISTPVTEKNITLVQHDHISHAIGEMQGYRFQMEDAFCDLDDVIEIKFKHGKKQLPPLPVIDRNKTDNSLTSTESNEISSITTSATNITNGSDVETSNTIKINIYGVFDGHGGTSTSKYISEVLPLTIKQRISDYINKLPLNDKLKLLDPNNNETLQIINFSKILKDAFMKVDQKFYYDPNNNSGSTAVVVIIFKDYIITANSGDSRCILSRNGNVKNLSFDHKPKNLGELMRIHSDGGYVSQNRVNSILALSRAFGDFNFKLQNNNNHGKFHLSRNNKRINLTPPEEFQVTVEPDILIQKLDKLQDEFMVVACDGIWDCYKSNDLIELIRRELSFGKKLPEINEIILDSCIGMANTITGIGFDNMTIIIVALHRDFNSLDTWYRLMKNKILDEKFGKSGH